MKLRTGSPEEIQEQTRRDRLVRKLIPMVRDAMEFRGITKDYWEDLYDATGYALQLLYGESWDAMVAEYREEMELVANVIHYGN